MKLLAIETATDACSVAILDGDCLLERFQWAQREQTRLILPMVQALLSEAGFQLSQMDVLAFGKGPGAFTGVRVATSVIQGLAFAADRPVVGISCLAACAQDALQHAPEGRILVAFDARMNEIYLGIYQQDANSGLVRPVIDDCLLSPHALPPMPEDVVVAAGAAGPHQGTLAASFPGMVWLADCVPRASAVARLAVAEYAAGGAVAPAQAQPLYLRNQVIQGAVR